MLFAASRFILWGILTAGVIFWFRKSRNIRKRLLTVLLAVLLLFTLTFTCMFPVENLFFSFDTPQSLFQYTNIGTIDTVIHGTDSCMIVYTKSGATGGHYIVPKKDNQYSIPNYFYTEQTSDVFEKDRHFEVEHVKNSNDYYVSGTVYLNDPNSEIAIYNGNNERIDSEVFKSEDGSFIYFYVNSFTNEHYIEFEGNKMLIS